MNRAIKSSLCWRSIKLASRTPVLNICSGEKVLIIYCVRQKTIGMFHSILLLFFCYEDPSVYAFRQCSRQCICEKCYENEGEIDMLRCVVCET